MDDISPILSEISSLGHSFDIRKIVLFGSRARGSHHQRSDIDLAVYGLTPQHKGTFSFSLEELPTLLKFDVVAIEPTTDTALLEQIQKEGVVIYDANQN